MTLKQKMTEWLEKYGDDDWINVRSDEWDDLDYIIDDSDVELIETDVVDEGRWTVTKERVYKIPDASGDMYVSVTREHPATESQEGGDFSGSACEVFPRVVLTTIYTTIKDA